MTFLKGAVYDGHDANANKVPGVRVAMGAADGVSTYGIVTTDDNGEYTHMLSSAGAKPGTYYLWVVDASGKRISPVGGPIVTNNLGPDAPGTCWHGWVDFFK